MTLWWVVHSTERHIGYDKNAQPVQVLPRPVTKFTNAVIDLAMSVCTFLCWLASPNDTKFLCFIRTRCSQPYWFLDMSNAFGTTDTVESSTFLPLHSQHCPHCIHSFPMQAFPSGIQPYRPPQSIKDACISKITCCDETFSALSSNGEVFTFSAAPSSNADTSSADGRAAVTVFKPQRVWALRKKFSAVKDVALGSDGSIIICTESGHVYVRTRNAKSSTGRTFKFERIPYLQRVTQVCANSTGAFGALRIDYKLKPIEVTGNMIAQDLKTVQPYLQLYRKPERRDLTSIARSEADDRRGMMAKSIDEFDDEAEDLNISHDIDSALELFEVLAGEQRMRKAGGGSFNYDGVRLPHDADTMIHLQSGAAVPVHRVILAARSRVLEELLSGSKQLADTQSKLSMKLMPARPGPGLGVSKLTRLSISGCHALSTLIFLRYLYSDELLALWDPRVGTVVEKQLRKLDVTPPQVKVELQAFSRLLDLPHLATALESPVKREPAPSMRQDLQRLFDLAQLPIARSLPLAPDVIIQLADKDVYTHSVILRGRTPLFASFFDLEDWTLKRWGPDGTIMLNMKHMKWHTLRFVLGFLCYGADKEMFQTLGMCLSSQRN